LSDARGIVMLTWRWLLSSRIAISVTPLYLSPCE
jgi:hypothetical protein